jgi:hypothetical protein
VKGDASRARNGVADLQLSYEGNADAAVPRIGQAWPQSS